jgi:hypothetical protein
MPEKGYELVTDQHHRTTSRDAWRVRILIDARADAAAVARHLGRFGCRVVELQPQGVLLELPNASGKADAEAEARLYLAMWRATHPSGGMTLTPSAREAT